MKKPQTLYIKNPAAHRLAQQLSKHKGVTLTDAVIGALEDQLNAAKKPKPIDRKKIDAAADREITFPLGGTNKGQMKGDDYLNHFMLPNFYFHCTAAYAILRHCGVDVGKRDFLGAIPLKMV